MHDPAEIERMINEKVDIFEKAFAQMRNEELGISENIDSDEHQKMIDALVEFNDWCVSCSLKDPTTRDLVLEVNKHQHFTKSCKKHGPKCKYGFPRFPSTKTLIAIPSRILYKDDEEKEQAMLDKSQKIKQKMADILDNEEVMTEAENHRNGEIEIHMENHRKIEEIELILAFKDLKNKNDSVKPKVSQALLDENNLTIESLIESPKEYLINLQKKYKYGMLNDNEMDVIREERLDILLQAAEIEGTTFEERNKNYVEALSISTQGYSVILKRDVDEIMINNYNPEWIKCWGGNMDIQVCLDFYAVITYITDYYMKDESGTMKVINEALSNSHDENLKKRMNIVKNAFLTSRQAGECEIYYKMLPFLHLSHSNIGTEFIHTGFRKNRSRFLKLITEDMKSDKMNVIEVEGKEGSFYVEKESIIDKYLRRPTCLNISLSQFVKRYEPVRKIPKKYSIKQFYIDIGKLDVYLNEKDAFSYESDDDSDSDNEFDTVVNEEKLIPVNEHEKIYNGKELDLESSTALPPFILLIAGNDAGAFKWMKKRKPKAIRFHKFTRVKDPHQW